MLTPKTDLLTFWAKEVSQEMSGITFCVCSISWAFRHILAAISKVFFLKPERAWWLVPCRNENKTQPRVMALRWQKPDPTIWWCTVSAKRMSRHKDRDLRSGKWRPMKKSWLCLRKLGHSDSNFEVGNSLVNRQENVTLAHRKLGQKHQTRAKSEDDSSSTRKLDASLPELENMRFSNHRYMWKIFQCLQKKLGRSAIDATFSIESFKTNVLMWGMFMASSRKAAIHLRPDFLMSSEIYKNTRSRT